MLLFSDEMINISVKINSGEFLINVNGHELKVDHADIPKRFFADVILMSVGIKPVISLQYAVRDERYSLAML